MPLKIAQLGQPILRQKALDVSPDEIQSPAFQQLLRDMRETLADAKGAGLAGPQVFAGKRVFLAAVLPPLEPEGPPQVEVFINPRFTGASRETGFSWEGCLSFAELLVYVERHKAVRIEFLNERGEAKSLDLVGFAARVVQHEYDHLEGLLTIDRVQTTRHIVKASEIDDVLEDEEYKEPEE
jgi:peptide deformylase